MSLQETAHESQAFNGIPKFESSCVEFKSAWSDAAKKTFCAFLNGRGGIVYFGVLDDGTPAGVASFDEISDTVSNVFRKGIHPDASDLFRIERIEERGRVIAAVVVKEGTDTPYSVDIKKEGSRIYVRKGSSTFEANHDEVRELYRKGDPIPYELRISRVQSLTFEGTRAVFERKQVEFSDRTMVLNGLTQSEDGRYTNLALWLSDQSPFEMRVGFFTGPTKASPSLGFHTFQGSILKQFEEIDALLERSFPFTFEVGTNGERVERHAYPPRALREALVNTCVHRDFSIMAQASVTSYSDRIEFLTLGALPPKCDFQKLRRGISICRNEALCRIFYRLGKMEKYGIGIPLIYDLYEGEPNQPVLEATDDMVCITLPRLDALPSIASMPERRRSIMLYIRQHEPVSRAQVQEAFGISYGTVAKELSELQLSGWIKRIGEARAARYVFNPERRI